MMIRPLLASLAAALLAAPAAAQTGPAAVPAAVPAADEAAKLRAIGTRGRLLFDLDRAAWVATDDFVKKVRDPASGGYKGYVVERDGAGFTVTFFGGEPLVGMYVAKVAGGRVTSGRLLADAERVPLTPLQLRLAAARSTAAASASGGGLRPCTAGPFNAALVPPASPEAPIELYLTSAQIQAGVYPFGGHFLLTIAPDGTVQSVRKFTNSCLNMPLPDGGRRGGKEPVAAVVSHMLDPIPTEIHAFLSIWLQRPVYVITNDPQRIWVVRGESIGLAGPDDKMARAIRTRT